MYKNITITIFVTIFILWASVFFHKGDVKNLQVEKLKNEHVLKDIPSIDHSKLPILNQDFKTPQEVTAACVSCHTESSHEVMHSSHWKWSRTAFIDGRGITNLGKKNLINNFCIGAGGNEQSCAKCHIGFGVMDKNIDKLNKAENVNNIDCMVCHDTSEKYIKGGSMHGYPKKDVNLKNVAKKVGKPTKESCGSCHFYSGGGNNVKHGDLEEALSSCSKDVDVHMAGNGVDMSCSECHTAKNHKIKGRLYSVSSENTNRAKCTDCHQENTHLDDLLNRHTAKIACQTCHIPEYAKVNSTKMNWKWSEAGRLKDGKPFHEENEYGDHDYMSIKGKFVWKRNVKPEYIWFNGTANHYLLGDTITEVPVRINRLNGSFEDINSKIIPVKIHRGNQIYDPKNNIMIRPKLYSPQKGDSAFWSDFDWKTAAAAGMKTAGLPYSGEYDFIETEMTWPLNHMVSPKEKSLSCEECHTRDNGRLSKLTGFYMPGRDYVWWVDLFGMLIVVGSIIGVLGHGAIRIFINKKNGK